MKQTTKLALAAFLNSSAGLLSALAADLSGATPAPADPVEAPAATAEAPAEEKKTRTKKAVVEKPTEPVVEKDAEEPAAEEKPATTGKTYEDMKAVIEPLVKAGQGAAVKAVIAKHSPTGKLVDMDPAKYADFEADIDALSY